jgi:peptidoglycan/LPS O-acetylase OafA/YrhL
MAPEDARYRTLDGMRGVAAFMVAAYHLAQRQPGTAFPGYLAVDLFFVVSGFVIAMNYTGRLSAGLTAARFTEARIIRLFPLYLCGLAVGLGKHLIGHLTHSSEALGFGLLACATAFGAVMLPWPCGTAMYPLNGPSWTLFFELAINVLFALTLWRLPIFALAAVMALAAAYLAATISAPLYFNVGWGWDNALQGAARTAYSFPAGVLIYRFLGRGTRRRSWLALVPLLATVALMLVDVPAGFRPATQLLIVLVGFPLLVIAGIRLEPPRRLAPVFGFLGDLSYPLYALHWPLIGIALPVMVKLHVPTSIAGATFVCAMIPIAYAASLIDVRMRTRLSTWNRRRAARARVVLPL